MKQLMPLKTENFNQVKKALGKDLKNRCDFCHKKIKPDNFGYLAINTVSCRDIICLTKAVEKEENDKPTSI